MVCEHARRTWAKECDGNMTATLQVIQRSHTEEFSKAEGSTAECPADVVNVERNVNRCGQAKAMF